MGHAIEEIIRQISRTTGIDFVGREHQSAILSNDDLLKEV